MFRAEQFSSHRQLSTLKYLTLQQLAMLLLAKCQQGNKVFKMIEFICQSHVVFCANRGFKSDLRNQINRCYFINMYIPHKSFCEKKNLKFDHKSNFVSLLFTGLIYYRLDQITICTQKYTLLIYIIMFAHQLDGKISHLPLQDWGSHR